MFKEIYEKVRASMPLVHCITNYVTVNDCANALLACGASPIMADDENEVEEITSICSALNINIGTLNNRTIVSMLKAGGKANELSHPVVLDPVGAGASSLRTSTAMDLIDNIVFSVIRGNFSEIKALAAGSRNTRGVDADINDSISGKNIEEVISFAKNLSKKTGSVVTVTGSVDIVADSHRVYLVHNGHPMMSKITGTGCMLSAIIAAYCGAVPGQPLEAAAAAVGMMGLCGEKAYERTVKENAGTATYRTYIIDEISRLDAAALSGGIKIEIR